MEMEIINVDTDIFNGQYSSLDAHRNRRDLMHQVEKQKCENKIMMILLIFVSISTTILLFILSVGIYVYITEHKNLKKMAILVTDINKRNLIGTIDNMIQYVDNFNITHKDVNVGILNIKKIAHVFDTTHEVTSFVKNIKYLVNKACSILICPHDLQKKFNISNITEIISRC